MYKIDDSNKEEYNQLSDYIFEGLFVHCAIGLHDSGDEERVVVGAV